MSPVSEGVGGGGDGRRTQRLARRLQLRPLYRVRGVPNIFDGTDHVIKNILHIYILSSGVYYNILSMSGSYYNIEFVFYKVQCFIPPVAGGPCYVYT